MSKNSAPSAPDYSGLISAATNQSQQYNQLMQQQLNFAQNAYQQNLPFYQQAMQGDLHAQQTQNDLADQQAAQYKQLYLPLQQDFVGQVQQYDSPDEVARARGQAMGAVAEQYGAAGQAATRQLQSYGIDPSAARFGALDIGTRTGQAAASAAAGTQSDINRETTGLGLKATALGLGSALPGQSSAASGASTGAGAGAVNATTGSYSPYAGALGNPTAFGSLGAQSLGMAGSFMNQGYQNQLAGYQAQQNSSSGIGSALGGLAGFASMIPWARGGRVTAGALPPPTDFPSPAARGSIPTASRPMSLPRGFHRLQNVPLTMKFDGGGAVPMAGQQVPPSMSPSGGARTDDIPAVVGQSPGGPAGAVPTARINADEFIMPKDVANWIGGKQLQNMVMKARKEMMTQAPAHGAPAGGPGQGAVPAGGPAAARYAGGGVVGGGMGRAATPSAVPAPRAPAAPRVGAAIPRGVLSVQRHVGVPGASTRVLPGPGFAGGAGKGVGMNLGGHQRPRPSVPVEGSPAGAVRSAVPGV